MDIDIVAVKQHVRLSGFLIIAGMIAGIFSVSPVVDSSEYLNETALNSNQVTISGCFQFIMALAYLGFAIFLYPIIKKCDQTFAIGFLCFRIVTAMLVILGTILLIAILTLSQELIKFHSTNLLNLEVLGSILKNARDHINHVFMIFSLGVSNLFLFYLFLKSKLIPAWISIWGILGTLLSILASILLLFQLIEVITPEYLVLNLPAAALELILSLWLIIKGINTKGVPHFVSNNTKH